MSELLTGNDVVAGLVAAGLFLALVLVAGLTPLVGVPLAVVAYVAIRLLLPRPDPSAAALRSCERLVAETRRLAATRELGRRPSGQKQVAQVADLLTQIVTLIASDRKKRAYAEPFLSDYLTPITAVLTPYVRLVGSNANLSGTDLSDTETDTLPRILEELGKLKDDLYRSDVTKLRTGRELVSLMSLPIVTRYEDGKS